MPRLTNMITIAIHGQSVKIDFPPYNNANHQWYDDNDGLYEAILDEPKPLEPNNARRQGVNHRWIRSLNLGSEVDRNRMYFIAEKLDGFSSISSGKDTRKSYNFTKELTNTGFDIRNLDQPLALTLEQIDAATRTDEPLSEINDEPITEVSISDIMADLDALSDMPERQLEPQPEPQAETQNTELAEQTEELELRNNSNVIMPEISEQTSDQDVTSELGLI